MYTAKTHTQKRCAKNKNQFSDESIKNKLKGKRGGKREGIGNGSGIRWCAEHRSISGYGLKTLLFFWINCWSSCHRLCCHSLCNPHLFFFVLVIEHFFLEKHFSPAVVKFHILSISAVVLIEGMLIR